MGNLCGLRTLAVLTGVSTQADLDRLVAAAPSAGSNSGEEADPALQVPELVLPEIGDLLPSL